MIGRYCVYKHISPSNKVYIGITCQTPSKRWGNGKGYPHNDYFTNAIQKYGWNNFKHEILFDSLTKDEACKKEIELIALYKSNQREFGYNQSSGGEEHNGCKCSEETKRKISCANLGKKAYNKGIPMSEEQKIKVSQSRKGKLIGKNNHNSKAVARYSLEGSLIKIYDSASQAGRELNFGYKNILACCNGEQKTALGSFWIFINELKQEELALRKQMADADNW